MGGKKPNAPAVVDTEKIAREEAEKERIKTIERQRRGMAGTIRTSHQGIVHNIETQQPQRKNLLGE